MAHPSRRNEADMLLMRLSTMPFSDVFIIFDELNDEWHTGRRALLGGTFGVSDWHVVLQDDAIISDQFYKNLVDALKNVPLRSLVSLYLGKVRPIPTRVKTAFNYAHMKNKSWLSFNTLLWGVCIAIPAEDIPKMLKYVEKSKELYDRRIGSYYYHLNQPVYYTRVSLVDHNDGLPSITGHGNTLTPRVAHEFEAGRRLTFNSKVEQI